MGEKRSRYEIRRREHSRRFENKNVFSEINKEAAGNVQFVSIDCSPHFTTAFFLFRWILLERHLFSNVWLAPRMKFSIVRVRQDEIEELEISWEFADFTVMGITVIMYLQLDERRVNWRSVCALGIRQHDDLIQIPDRWLFLLHTRARTLWGLVFIYDRRDEETRRKPVAEAEILRTSFSLF